MQKTFSAFTSRYMLQEQLDLFASMPTLEEMWLHNRREEYTRSVIGTLVGAICKRANADLRCRVYIKILEREYFMG